MTFTDSSDSHLIPLPLLSLHMDERQSTDIKMTKIVTSNINPPRRLKRVSEEMENFISNISNNWIYFSLVTALLYGFIIKLERAGEQCRLPHDRSKLGNC